MTAIAQSNAEPRAGSSLRLRRLAQRWGRPILGIGLAGVLAPFVVSQRNNLGRCFGEFGSLSPTWTATALVAEFVSMFAFALVQRQMVKASGPPPPTRTMVELAYAANALSATLPGGSAISLAYLTHKLRGWGVSTAGTAFALVASGVLSTTAFAALVLTRGIANGNRDGLLVALGTSTTLAGLARADHLREAAVRWTIAAGKAGLATIARLLRRPALLATLAAFANDLSRVHPTRRQWLTGLGLAETNWLLDLVCFLACCQAVGGTRVALTMATSAYLVGMTASTLSLLPGGLGAVEGGMIAVLASAHVNLVAATAAVFLYRIISMFLVVAVDWIAVGIISRRSHNRPSKPGNNPMLGDAAPSTQPLQELTQ